MYCVTVDILLQKIYRLGKNICSLFLLLMVLEILGIQQFTNGNLVRVYSAHHIKK